MIKANTYLLLGVAPNFNLQHAESLASVVFTTTQRRSRTVFFFISGLQRRAKSRTNSKVKIHITRSVEFVEFTRTREDFEVRLESAMTRSRPVGR